MAAMACGYNLSSQEQEWPWHHGCLDRDQSESLLRLCEMNAWLVRRNPDRDFHVLSRKTRGPSTRATNEQGTAGSRYSLDPTSQRAKEQFRFQHFKINQEVTTSTTKTGRGKSKQQTRYFLKSGVTFKSVNELVKFYMQNSLKEKNGDGPFLEEALAVRRASGDDFFDDLSTDSSSFSSEDEDANLTPPPPPSPILCVPTALDGPLWRRDQEEERKGIIQDVIAEEDEEHVESEKGKEEAPDQAADAAVDVVESAGSSLVLSPQPSKEEEEETAEEEKEGKDDNAQKAKQEDGRILTATKPDILPIENSNNSNKIQQHQYQHQQSRPDDRILLYESLSLAEDCRKLRDLALAVEARANRMLRRVGNSQQLLQTPVAPRTDEAVPEKGATLRVIRGYRPAYADELELVAGAELVFVKRVENGWWEGREPKSGQVGIFPSDFVTAVDAKIDEEEENN